MSSVWKKVVAYPEGCVHLRQQISSGHLSWDQIADVVVVVIVIATVVVEVVVVVVADDVAEAVRDLDALSLGLGPRRG